MKEGLFNLNSHTFIPHTAALIPCFAAHPDGSRAHLNWCGRALDLEGLRALGFEVAGARRLCACAAFLKVGIVGRLALSRV